MSNSTTITVPLVLGLIQEKLTYTVLPMYVVLGVIGNSFCIIYFLQKAQRTSSCAFYLLLVAITNIFAVTFGVGTTILNTWNSVASVSLVYCKLRMYINHSLIFIGRMFTILATMDTFAMSSPNHLWRSFSQRSNAIKYAVIVMFACLLIAVHIPIMNTIVAKQCVMTGVYATIFAAYQMFIAGIFPPITMTVFSYLAYMNMKKNIFRNDQMVNQTKRQYQRQLLRMVTTQITIYIISAELTPLMTVYRQWTSNITDKSADRRAIESFLTYFAMNILLYLNTWAPFFIYFTTSSNFRTAFIRLFKKDYRIQPMNVTIGMNTFSTMRRA